MDLSFLFYLSSGLFLGWSVGASEASNFGSAVATKMIKFRTAAVIASVCVIIGAVYAGAGTSQTLGKLGGINTLPGAFMAAFSAALAAYWMVKLAIPVSTSQAIVGAIIGWNFFSGRPTDISTLSQIVSAWILGPVLAGIIAIHLLRKDCYTRVALILAGAFGSYALGANNIANVMGVFVDSSPLQKLELPLGLTLNSAQVLFLLGGIAIAVGISTYSKKVIYTVGNTIMKLSPLMAWVVVAAQGLVLFIFSSKGLQEFLLNLGLPALPLVPVSSTQAVIGAVVGLGVAKGGHVLNWPVLGKVGISCIITPIFAALICYISLFFLQNVFGQVVYK